MLGLSVAVAVGAAAGLRIPVRNLYPRGNADPEQGRLYAIRGICIGCHQSISAGQNIRPDGIETMEEREIAYMKRKGSSQGLSLEVAMGRLQTSAGFEAGVYDNRLCSRSVIELQQSTEPFLTLYVSFPVFI